VKKDNMIKYKNVVWATSPHGRGLPSFIQQLALLGFCFPALTLGL